MTTHAFGSSFRHFNPFLDPGDVSTCEPEAREVSYALVQSGPSVAPEEVESHVETVEVKVRWGTQALLFTHLDPGKGFSIGADGADFVLPDLDRTPLVESRGGLRYAVIPQDATATACEDGGGPRPLGAGEEIELRAGTSVTVELGAVTIEIAVVRAGRKYELGLFGALLSSATVFVGLSFLGHASVLASLAMFMPNLNADDAEGISREQLLKMHAMLDASSEREKELVESRAAASEESNGGGSQGGEAHMGESGAAGTTRPVSSKGHMAFKGSDDQARLSKLVELELASTGGLIGILNAGAPLSGPSSPWALETQLGMDADDKIGAMFGSDANDAMGYGIGLWGTGEGGGGKGLGVGIDGVGNTVGGGGGGPGKWGYGKGDKDGWGNGHGPGRGGYVAKTISIRSPSVQTNGRIPAEVIQRIVRQNFGRFRLCYEAGLRSNPGLSGRVVTKFVIGRDGAVAQAQDAGSDMASQEVVSCIVRSFNSLSFPQPEGGIATVTYPIVLSPGD